MHLATVTEEVKWLHPLEAGNYWLEDHNAAELLWASRSFGSVSLKAQRSPQWNRENLWKSGTRVLIVRVGGFGDLLWLNPIYAEMKKAGVYIGHCCFPRYAPILEGYVDEIVPYPLSISDTMRFDEIVWLENSIEKTPCLDEHPAERFQRLLGVPVLSDIPFSGYQLQDGEKEWAATQWPRGEKKRVCVQATTSGIGKNYPRMQELLAGLFAAEYEILMVGEPRGAQEQVPNSVFDCTQKNFTMRQSIAMAAHCDAIIAPDSAFVHIGNALKIPVVGLFGPFSAKSYMKNYLGVAMQGRGKCSPCSWHPRGTPFPSDQECSKSGYCNALANIPAKDVLFMMKQAMKR